MGFYGFTNPISDKRLFIHSLISDFSGHFKVFAIFALEIYITQRKKYIILLKLERLIILGGLNLELSSKCLYKYLNDIKLYKIIFFMKVNFENIIKYKKYE